MGGDTPSLVLFNADTISTFDGEQYDTFGGGGTKDNDAQSYSSNDSGHKTQFDISRHGANYLVYSGQCDYDDDSDSPDCANCCDWRSGFQEKLK